MRLNINLASQPYENVRRFAVRWGLMLVALALVTGALCYLAVKSWRDSRDVNRQISAIESEIRALDAEKQSGLALLNQPHNRTTADESRFLNQLIARKAFSWTTVFMDLERLMPPGLHVVSVTPELGADNQLQVRMLVGGSSRDRAVELVRRMEESPTFRQAQVQSETARPADASTGDPIQFEITSVYVPQNLSAVRESNKEPEGKKSGEEQSPPPARNVGGLQ